MLTPDNRLYDSYSIVTIELTHVGDKVVVHVAGRMDAENATQFDQKCEACIAEGVTTMVADLEELVYISSMGLRSFIALGKTLQEKGGQLRICRANGLVKQVFTITRINIIFPLHESVESALA